MKDVCSQYDKFCDIITSNNLLEGVKKVILLFSCGKDCSFMLDLFLRYMNDSGSNYDLNIFSVAFPRHMYYDASERERENFQAIRKYWDSRNVNIEYISPECADFEDDDRLGCLVCKKIRKSIIDPFVNEHEVGTSIMTGFTMYDILSYVNILMLHTNYNLGSFHTLAEPTKSLMTKMLHKLTLKEILPNKKIMIRPILPFDEMEVTHYLIEKNIPYLNTPCKISKYKFKRQYSNALNLYSPLPVSYDDILRFLACSGININGTLSFNNMEEDNYFIDC